MKPLRVLVVEDDLLIGPLLAELLEDLGHVVCAVEVDAAAAVAAARRCHPDLMIVDVGFGEVSGIAAVKEILKEGFVPHVFVTGDVLRGLSLGPDAYSSRSPIGGRNSSRRSRGRSPAGRVKMRSVQFSDLRDPLCPRAARRGVRGREPPARLPRRWRSRGR